MLETVRYLIPYTARYKWKYIAGTLFVVMANIFRISNPRIIQSAIDYLSAGFEPSTLVFYAGLIVLAALLEGLFLFLMRRSMIVASREVENDLRNSFFNRLTTLSPLFYQENPTGDIMSRATNDLSAVRSIVGPGIAYSVNTIMAFCFVIPMMLVISPRLTIYAAMPFPIIALLVNRFGKAIYHRFERIQNQFSTLSTRAQENISGNTIIKWFTRETHEIERFREASYEYMRRNISYAKVNAAFRPSLMLTVGIAQALIILVGGGQVIDGVITLGEFTAFMLYLGILVWPSIALGWVIGLFQQGAASMHRMRVVLDATPDITDQPGALRPDKFDGDIRYNHLVFAYADGREVLSDISIHFPARSTVGIIGPTGSGKTTLVKQIPHFYTLPDQTLYVDTMDINTISCEHLRKSIGYVPQENFLFSDTIHNNIAYSNPGATREQVVDAAQMACVHEDIMQFTNGYDALLGEKGINLSGGQKQRVSIARAILRQPDILILDDAFSALDTQTEDQILRNLSRFFPDRTVILVSHRVSTLQNADLIIVMEDGRITEHGKHADLVEDDGMYRWIYEKQLLEEELSRVE